ncbi:alpha/beta hydrolase family protein [Actinocrispum wychmicini]|uniref:Prolyl oligopeptidase family protein n=1 Tax=Actinocrispum wychmicini TaxID=1213861 RepID=A0A4R2K3V5_9PSEU|nr:prolyl oligopeptidase family serine peptidase [Actinocrispum wychmicini]TCO60995.1 prolyl oligopeptidase family protein [Actinocrispum wychmicini]
MPDLSYDSDADFDITVRTIAERPGVVISDCRFDNVEGDPVDCYLVAPVGSPSAGVVFQHTTGGREAFLPEAVQVAEAGGIALSMAPFTMPDAATVRQSIFATRRAADILFRQVDRVGLVGHSGGSMVSAVVGGIDHRFACLVIEAGLSGLTFHLRDSKHPMIAGLRAATPADVFEATLAELSPYDAVHFIGDVAPTPLLFQFPRFDIGVTKAEFEAFYAAANEPKQQLWYDSGHVVNDPAAFADRARFLADHLGLDRLPGILTGRTTG